MANRSDIQELVDNWVYWVSTRRFYAPPIPKNMLAMMQVNRASSKEPPNARNDALCAAFNMVISIADKDIRLPFLYVYAKQYRPAPIKTLADELSLTRETIYQRAHFAAERFYNQALRLAETNSKMPEYTEEDVD